MRSLCENHRLQIFGVLLSLGFFPLPQAFFYGAGSSVSALRYLTSSQKRSLPLAASEQEQISDGRAVDECPVQKPQYLPRGPQDRGDAPGRPLPTLRGGGGSRSAGTAPAGDEADAQVPETHGNQSHTGHGLSGLLVLWELAVTGHIARAPAGTHTHNRLNPELGEGGGKEVHVPLWNSLLEVSWVCFFWLTVAGDY